MGHPIGAPGQVTDYSDAIPGQFGGQASRGFSSIRRQPLVPTTDMDLSSDGNKAPLYKGPFI